MLPNDLELRLDPRPDIKAIPRIKISPDIFTLYCQTHIVVTITNKQKCEGIARTIQVHTCLVSKLECRISVLWWWVDGGGLDLNASQDYLHRSRGDGWGQLV